MIFDEIEEKLMMVVCLFVVRCGSVVWMIVIMFIMFMLSVVS